MSSIVFGSSAGTLSSAASITVAARSSGRTSTSEPLAARPIGDLAVATITASDTAPPRVLLVSNHATSRTGDPLRPRHVVDVGSFWIRQWPAAAMTKLCPPPAGPAVVSGDLRGNHFGPRFPGGFHRSLRDGKHLVPAHCLRPFLFLR